ncbi:MAG: hypothetical protein IPN89_06315 [Saprospiraceae bacterium]|nr:hypothetical protein [Saprospiraceae bacterium]
MQRVSSNLTIFFKLFLPTAWIVFFTVFTALLFIVDDQQLPFLTSPVFKYPFLFLYLMFFALLYFTIIQLKRVEMGPDSYVVTNYFKTYRLIYEDISSIHIIPLGRLQIVTFRLKSKGKIGNKITFLASKHLFQSFLESHPEVDQQLKKLIK